MKNPLKNLSGGVCSFLVILAGVLWGTMGLFIRKLNSLGLESLDISALRSIITAVVLLVAVLMIRPQWLKIKLKDIWCFFGTGCLSVLFFNYCYFLTIQASSMAVAATLLYTAPAFVMVMSIFLFGEKLTGRKLVALSLAIAGCVFVSGIITGGGNLSFKGILLGIGAGLGYALYSIFGRFALKRGYESMTISVYTFIFAALGGLFFIDFSHVGTAYSQMGVPFIFYILLYALVTTVFPYVLYTFGLTGLENSKASVLASVEPVTAAVLGFLVFRELPDVFSLIGIVLVLSAVVLLNVGGKKKEENSDKQ